MPIELVCQCGKRFSVPDQFAGKKASCKACGAKLLIPSPAAPAAAYVPAATIPAVAPDKAPADEVLYDAHPSMFRNHPVGFVIGILFFAVLTLIAVFMPTAPSDPLWPRFALPGGIALIYVIWWLKCRNSRLTITNRKITYRQGILSKSLNEVRLIDVRNVLVRQGLFQRMFGVGAVGISTSGQSGIEIEARGIPHPGRVREIIDRYRG